MFQVEVVTARLRQRETKFVNLVLRTLTPGYRHHCLHISSSNFDTQRGASGTMVSDVLDPTVPKRSFPSQSQYRYSTPRTPSLRRTTETFVMTKLPTTRLFTVPL